jgi:PilZ domain
MTTAPPGPGGPDPHDDRRAHRRLIGPFDGLRSGETPVQFYDLSEGGCFVNSFEEPDAGRIISLTITLPTEGEITVKAETMHNKSGFGFGVRFVEISGEDRARLRRALDRIRT